MRKCNLPLLRAFALCAAAGRYPVPAGISASGQAGKLLVGLARFACDDARKVVAVQRFELFEHLGQLGDHTAA